MSWKKMVIRNGSLATILAASSFGIAPALAQSDAADSDASLGVPDEIIVTAQRREQALQDVPLSVTALGSDMLESKGIRGLSDLAAGQIPSVIFNPNSGRNEVLQISIRGLGTNDPSQGTRELPVPLYIDGVFLGRSQGTGLELVEPERIEVLRGPQGTLFGRNAEGGAVQFVTKKPSGELSGNLSGSLGNYDFRRIRGRIDLPEFAGFKLQLAGLYSDRGPFTRNRPADTLGSGEISGLPRRQADLGARNEKGFRAAVRYDGIEGLTVDYAFDWSRGKASQAYLQYRGPAYVGGEMPSDSYVHETTRASYQNPFKTRVSGHALTIAVDASDAITLKSITSFRKVRYEGYTGLAALDVAPAFGFPDVPGTLIYPLSDEDLRQKQFSQEVQLLGSWDNLQLTTGAIYYRESLTQFQHTNGLAGPGLLLAGLPVDFSPGPDYGQRARTKSLGLYVQATYTPPILDEKLELTAGLRYSRDRKNAVRFQVPANPINPFDPSVVAANIRAPFSENRWDPAFTAKYNFTSDINVYLRYSQAYRAGGVNIRSLGFQPYDEEVLKAFELGFKAQTSDRRFIFNAALYQNKLYNPQVDVRESLIAQTATRTINAPITTRTRGVELEATYFTPLQGLTLGANYSYMHVKQPSFINPDDLAQGEVTINKLFAPKHSGSFSADYKVPVGFGTLALHGDYSFASRFFTTIEINPIGAVPKPQRPLRTRQLNGRIAVEDIELGGAKADLSFWAKNILKREDVTYSFTVLGDPVHNFFYVTEPRTYGVDLTIKF
jgi:iron complex outermembrane receptor protein